MKTQRPTRLILLAALQIVPLAILPPSTWRNMPPVVIGIMVALFALLGISLLRLRAWSIMASIFLQGMNIIIRLLIAAGHATSETTTGAPTVDLWLLGTFAVSIALSWFFLQELDRPEIRMVTR